MLAILQERLRNQRRVHVTALQLREQGVGVEVPNLIQVSEDEFSLEKGQITPFHLVSVANQHHLEVLHVIQLGVAQLFNDVLSSKTKCKINTNFL